MLVLARWSCSHYARGPSLHVRSDGGCGLGSVVGVMLFWVKYLGIGGALGSSLVFFMAVVVIVLVLGEVLWDFGGTSLAGVSVVGLAYFIAAVFIALVVLVLLHAGGLCVARRLSEHCFISVVARRRSASPLIYVLQFILKVRRQGRAYALGAEYLLVLLWLLVDLVSAAVVLGEVVLVELFLYVLKVLVGVQLLLVVLLACSFSMLAVLFGGQIAFFMLVVFVGVQLALMLVVLIGVQLRSFVLAVLDGVQLFVLVVLMAGSFLAFAVLNGVQILLLGFLGGTLVLVFALVLAVMDGVTLSLLVVLLACSFLMLAVLFGGQLLLFMLAVFVQLLSFVLAVLDGVQLYVLLVLNGVQLILLVVLQCGQLLHDAVLGVAVLWVKLFFIMAVLWDAVLMAVLVVTVLVDFDLHVQILELFLFVVLESDSPLQIFGLILVVSEFSIMLKFIGAVQSVLEMLERVSARRWLDFSPCLRCSSRLRCGGLQLSMGTSCIRPCSPCTPSRRRAVTQAR